MKKVYLLVPLFLLLVGCHQKIVEEDLIGGHWVGTAGYEEGESTCLSLVTEGLEFIDETIVYSKGYDSHFEYQIEERQNGTAIEFNREGTYYSYYIDRINGDEMGLTGVEGRQEEESCYLQRETCRNMSRE